MGFEFFSRMPGALFRQAVASPQPADDSVRRSTLMKLDEHLNKEGPAGKPEEPHHHHSQQQQQQQQQQGHQHQAPTTPKRGGRGGAGEPDKQGQEGDCKHAHAMATKKGYVIVEAPCMPSASMEQDAVVSLVQQGTTVVVPAGGKEDEGDPGVVMQQQQQQQQQQQHNSQPLPYEVAHIQEPQPQHQQSTPMVPLPPLPVVIPAEPDNRPSSSTPTNATNNSSSSRGNPTITIPKPQHQQQPPLQLQRKRIPVDPAWEGKVVYVMAQYYQEDNSETPLAVIKNLSGALSIELIQPSSEGSSSSSNSCRSSSGLEIEIVAKTWQELKEAEALLRLVFQYYKGEGKWWLYTIPTFVSCIIAGTKGTELPQFSNPSLGLHCAIAPYDEASTRRAFFLTCPEWGPQDAAYHFIKKCWEYWKELGLERQLDRYLSVLLGVVVVPIRADGNCLFRALAKSVMGEEEAHMVVRKAVVGFLRRSDELKSFIVAEDEGEDSAAFAERYCGEMEKDGTWGDQVEITAFTHVYRRPVRVWSYNYAEARLLSVITPLDEPTPTTPSSTPTATGAAVATAPEEEIWLLHLHGHYSLLQKGEPPQDVAWEKMLREWGERKEECTNVQSARQQQQRQQLLPLQPQELQKKEGGEIAQEKEEGKERRREGVRELPKVIPALPEEAEEQEEEGRKGLQILMEEDADSGRRRGMEAAEVGR